MIAISLSPNTEPEDVGLAIQMLLKPWEWKRGDSVRNVEIWFNDYFNVDTATAFNSGRSALFAILKALGIGAGDEVLLQAFTCVAVPNSVLWVGARPIFVDIDSETFTIDSADLERKITRKTRAIIVQHTFGIPADIKKIQSIARKHKLVLIEDCAHALGAVVDGMKVGSFGDAAFFSFGRDKVLSGVFGGLAIINKKKGKEALYRGYATALRAFQKNLEYPSALWILQQVLHPILFSVIIPLYNTLEFGKILLVLFQKLHVLSFPVYAQERYGRKPDIFPAKLPNALATLILNQLTKLARYNKRRVEIARYYGKTKAGAIYLRYPILVNDPFSIYKEAKRNKILLGRWYAHVIDPAGVDYESVGYKRESCPHAEGAAARILNLPTYPKMSIKEAQKVRNLLDKKRI